MVIEDDQTVRKLAVKVLKQSGYKVHEAQSGGDALIFCEKLNKPLDLVVTDVVMPGLSGEEVLARIRQRWPEVKAIYMSGYTPGYVYQEGGLDTTIPYIQKPFRPADFTRIIRETLDSGK